jgi:hypothetical protein
MPLQFQTNQPHRIPVVEHDSFRLNFIDEVFIRHRWQNLTAAIGLLPMS